MLQTARVLIAFGVLVTVSSSWAKVPLNAFIESAATSRAELLGQFDKNPTVRDRYQRHFAMTGSELRSYLASLSPGKLAAAGLYTVYNVPTNGVLRSRLLRLKQGTKVWLDMTGRPTLMMICGNPLTRGPNRVETATDVVASIHGVEEDITKTLPTEKGAPVPDTLVPVVLIANLEPRFPDVVSDDMTIVAEIPQSDAIPSLMSPSIPGLGALAGVPAIPWFLPPSIAGVVIVFPSLNPTGHREPPVPEPATLLALGVGAVGFAARRLRR